MTEGWPIDVALETFRGIYEDKLRANCPMGLACQLGGVAIVSTEVPSEASGNPVKLMLVCDCPVERCPAEIVFGIAAQEAIRSAQGIGLIIDGSLSDES